MHMDTIIIIAMYQLGSLVTYTRYIPVVLYKLNDVIIEFNNFNFKIACYVANHEFEIINFLTIGSQYIRIVNCDNIIYISS